MYRPLTLIVASLALTACGGGSSSSDDSGPESTFSVEQYKSLSSAEVEAVILKPASAEELETQLKNGLRLGVYINTSEIDDFPRTSLPVETIELAENSLAADAQSSEFSQTNTHFQGVDEADFVKYDGQHIYMVTHPEYIWDEELPSAEIRIMETDPTNAGINEVGTIVLDNGSWGEVSELYLAGDSGGAESLVTLRSSWNYLIAAEPFIDVMADIWWPGNFDNKIELSSYDVSAPSAPEKSFTLEIDGVLHNSRKVGNTLYLVTQFSPHVPEIQYYFTSAEEAEENEMKIQDLSLQDLLPQVSINGNETQALLDAEDCLIPVTSDNLIGYKNIMSFIAIDLQTQEITATRCISANVQGIYATQNNFYIGASTSQVWEGFNSFTAIHKFALDDELSYRSSGFVQGSLGWRDASFRMHEYDDLLHVVSTTRDENWSPVHHLSVLRDSETTDEMEVISQIPNENRPDAIGKPNEDIYAVRFLEDKAYVVTFERIDPLYIIDLSNPEDPQITGELEVPGFSTYLHPVGDSYLLGVGQDSGQNTGLKVSLYNVADISDPQLLASETLGSTRSRSAAEYDLRAMSFLQADNDQLRFALPTSLYDEQWVWQEESLQLFEINGLAGEQASLDRVGTIESETNGGEQNWPSVSGTDRSVLHEDAVYYIHGSEVWSSFWSSPENATGPH